MINCGVNMRWLNKTKTPQWVISYGIVFACTMILCWCFSCSRAVAANKSQLSGAELEEFAQNDILFYDPSADCSKGGKTEYCTTPSGSDITWIGDSYSILAKDAIDAAFPGVDYGGPISDSAQLGDGNTYIASGKCVDQAGIDSNVSDNPSGLTILQRVKDEGKLRPYLVFALGTNKGWTQAMMDKFLEIVGDDTKVVLVSIKTYNSAHGVSDNSTSGIDGGNYDSSNAILEKAAEEHSNIYLADWVAGYKDEYFAASSDDGGDGIHPGVGDGYKVWIDSIKTALPQVCTAGLLPGDNVAEKIWNYFVQADIEGLSDNAAAIAGIMGNFYGESGLNPFMHGSGGSYYRGLYMLNSDSAGSLWSQINDAVGADYWSFEKYGWWCTVGDYPDGGSCADSVLSDNGVPQDAIDTAIKMELDFLVLGKLNGEDVSNQSFHSEFMDFLDNFDVITNKDSPRSYAELFLITVEIAYEAGGVASQAPQDPGVRELGISRGHERWQDAEGRGSNAETIFDKYANTAVPTTTSYTGSATHNSSNTTAASSGGFTKYDDLTDAQIQDLAEVAIAESGDSDKSAFGNLISIMANIYEKNNSSSQNGTGLVDYVKNSEKDLFSKVSYINGSSDNEVAAAYIDTVRDVLVSGNRTLPKQIVFFNKKDAVKTAVTTSDSSDVKDKPDSWKKGEVQIENNNGGKYIFYGWLDNGKNMVMGYAEGDPPTDSSDATSSGEGVCEDSSSNTNGVGGAQIAKAAVEMSWPVQSGQDDDTHIGQCKDANGSWQTYSTAGYPPSCATNPRDLYRQQLDTWLPGDNGMDCGKFVTTVLRYTETADTKNNSALEAYFETDDMWEKLSDPSTENLKPGDVGFSPGHTFIYVGEYGGTYGVVASASQGERVGQVTQYYNESSTTSAWRYKGGIGDGLTQEQAEKLVYNYNHNVGNWDGKVAVEENYCQGNTCASRYSNCTLFSAFFVEMFTDVGFGNGWPSGIDVVDKLVGMGFERGTEPKPFAVFSTSTYRTPSGNHTGVVVGVDGDKIAIVEAGYPSENGVYVDYTDVSGEDIWYAYLDSRLDYSKLMDYINQ